MALKLFTASFVVAPAASATDIFELTSASGKFIRVKKILISGIQTTGSHALFVLKKRSSAATGGTNTSATFVDQGTWELGASQSPSCTCKIYTANPTVGTLIGDIRNLRVPIPASTGPVQGVTEINFGDEGLLIRAGEYLCGNLNGATLTGGSIAINIDLTEQ